MGAAQALPGPHFLVAAGGQARGQAPRLKLGLVGDLQPLRPAGKLPVILRRHGGQQVEIRPPAGLDLLAAGGKLDVQHVQKVQLFPQGAFLPHGAAAQQAVFLLQNADIAPVQRQIPRVQLAQRRIQKAAAAVGRALDQAQVPRVEHHGGEAARQAGSPFGGRAVADSVAAGPAGTRRAHGQADLVFLAAGFHRHGLQRGVFGAAPHQFGVLAAPEALAPGQQPDRFQQVRLALAVVAADDGQLRAGDQGSRRDVAVIFQSQ